MKQIRNLMPPKRLLAACLLLFSTFFIHQSCTKLDTPAPSGKALADAEISQRFFNVPANAPLAVRRASNAMKERNNASEYVKAFAGTNGYPVWDKAFFPAQEAATAPSFGNDVGADTIVIIPVLAQGSTVVMSFVRARLDGAVSLDYFRCADYSAYSFDEVPADSMNADKAAFQMMDLNNRVFGYTEFKVADKRLFNYSNNYTDTGLKRLTVRLAPSGTNLYQTCNLVTITWLFKHCPYGDNCSGPNGTCDWCIPTCATGISDTHLQCSTYDEGGGSPTGPTDPTGGPTGGSGSSPAYPCASSQGKGIAVANPCGTNPTIPPVVPLPLKDDNGFYYARIDSLNSLFHDNPFAADPCDSLTLMNIATYGPMYQRIAGYSAPQNVISRLDSVRQAQGGWVVDNYNIQSLQDAYGPVVNCDYFPLQVSQFPMNNSTGLRMTPSEFLEYFRLNINNFITPPVEVNFSCIFGPQFDDCAKWNQDGANSLGALNHIYIGGPSISSNNGSIILSDYHHDNTINHESHYFKVSTLETPFDYEHPVAGNREFGIFSNAAAPNQYTFYTMGVDRVWDWITQVLQPSPNYGFNKADELWTNVQQNLKNYINSNGGSANLYVQQKYVARPDWDLAKKYLLKQITYNQYKALLGCP
jgi:hypothetical protein